MTGYKPLELQPITIREAQEFIAKHHRHHPPPVGAKFAVGVSCDGTLAGVATIGRPVARMLDDGWTLEVTRVCTLNGFKNAASMLYAAAWRASRAMGYKRLISYILKTEEGTSLVAAGYKEIGVAGGGSWNRGERARIDKHPTEQKKLFEITNIKGS
jgi:hypothetical protein